MAERWQHRDRTFGETRTAVVHRLIGEQHETMPWCEERETRKGKRRETVVLTHETNPI